MKEIMEIFMCEQLSDQAKERILRKMVRPLDHQMGANIYGEIIDELISSLKEN